MQNLTSISSISARVWRHLGSSWRHLGSSWHILGTLGDTLETSWETLGEAPCITPWGVPWGAPVVVFRKTGVFAILLIILWNPIISNCDLHNKIHDEILLWRSKVRMNRFRQIIKKIALFWDLFWGPKRSPKKAWFGESWWVLVSLGVVWVWESTSLTRLSHDDAR